MCADKEHRQCGSGPPAAPEGAAHTSTGCGFLLGLAVGPEGKAGPSEVTGRSATNTGANLLQGSQLKAELRRTSQEPSLGTKMWLKPGVCCVVARSQLGASPRQVITS